MSKTLQEFEDAMSAVVDPFVETVREATETMATNLMPLVKELEASDIAKEYKLALINRLCNKLTQEEAATEAFFLSALG